MQRRECAPFTASFATNVYTHTFCISAVVIVIVFKPLQAKLLPFGIVTPSFGGCWLNEDLTEDLKKRSLQFFCFLAM
jgi:hypothetical protein